MFNMAGSAVHAADCRLPPNWLKLSVAAPLGLRPAQHTEFWQGLFKKHRNVECCEEPKVADFCHKPLPKTMLYMNAPSAISQLAKLGDAE